MTTLFKPVQVQDFSLAGAGVLAGDTSIVLKSFKTIDGVNLAMTDFGVIGFATLEPGNGTQEEQVSFTGVAQNSNGTATLSGVSTVLFLSPYTASSGCAKTHAGSTVFIISNTSGFYNKYPAKANDETITGQWTFNSFPITPSNSDASTTVKGVTKLSTAPDSATEPIATGTNDGRVPVAYAVDSVGTDAYAITPSPVIAAYVAGQHFTFKAGTANTDAATLNVSGLGAIVIKKNVSSDLVTGDILVNQIVEVVYDGTNMQMISKTSPASNSVILTYINAGSPATWTKQAGLKYVIVELVAGGGTGADKGAALIGGGGGGGGGYAKRLITAGSLGATETVTTGAATQSSSFGAWLSATAGASTSSTNGGAGGVGSSGDINISGQGGSGAGNGGGAGGSSMMGGGGAGGQSGGNGGASGNYGGGGGGAGANAGTGAAGAPGLVVVYEFYV